MLLNHKIGIVGYGFVGSAVSQLLQNFVVVDVDPLLNTGTFDDLMDCRAVFVCVPSPADVNGRCDTRALEAVLFKLKNYRGPIISKVTAPPDVYRRLNEEYFNLVYSPEFLRAEKAKTDYLRSEFIVVGGSVNAYVNEAAEVIKYTMESNPIVIKCSAEEASFMKYAINTFLASKVVFMNELKRLADAADVDYETVTKLLTLDKRIGASHMQVPGPDGSYGFGGMCFPKDTQAFLSFANDMGVNLSVLETVTKTNTMLRLSDK